jgi:quercetin dioxygenase-like cupin family protein
MDNIHKIWGERRRILLTRRTEIDLLYLKKDHFCSTHFHSQKNNKFYVISGKIKIQTELGETILTKDEHFTVFPPMVHRFYAIEDSIMIELAYVKNGAINDMDIHRKSQGGKIIENKEYTLNELKEKGMLNL